MPPDDRPTQPPPLAPDGRSDPGSRQMEMHAPADDPAARLPVVLIFNDLLNAATDGTLRWERLRDGIEIARLYVTHESGPSAALLRYAPGARLQRHVHTGFEHIYVLTGSQIDDRGEHCAGALLIHGPGTSHTIASPRGCVVLAFWEKPVRF